MRPQPALAGMLLTLLLSGGICCSGAAAAIPAADVDVALDRDRLSTVVGERFTVRSRFVNPGPASTDPSLAHLNVASLTSDVYVDPEDWSSSRSRPVASLAAGTATSLTWELQAVNAGSFDVYVVLLPNGASSAGTGPLVVSRPMHVRVAERRALNAGGSLPVVFGVPVLLGLLVVAARYRVRRSD